MDEQGFDHATAAGPTGDDAAVDGYEPPTIEDLQHPDGPTGIPAGPGVTSFAAPREI